jgi:gliding motility associated protien GldN
MKLLFYFNTLLLSLWCNNVFSQTSQGDIKCDNIEQNIPVPWQLFKEGDVNFSKRIVRIIDLREKQNQVLLYPKNALPIIMYEAIKTKKLIPFKNDSCTSVYSTESILKMGTDTQFVENPNPENPEEVKTDTVVTPFDPLTRIYKLRIVEDWLYDKKHSSYVIKIVSLAPVYKLKIAGIDLGDQDLCVFRYYYNDINKPKDIRNLFAKKCVFNRQNNAAMMSFDAFFEGRYFSSYVVKASNQRDFYIKDQSEYKDNGLDAILENQNLQDDLIKREQDYYDN